jgi:hypothetical protein
LVSVRVAERGVDDVSQKVCGVAEIVQLLQLLQLVMVTAMLLPVLTLADDLPVGLGETKTLMASVTEVVLGQQVLSDE